MNKYAERLLKLADHLSSNQQYYKKFDYARIENSCGTAGCALGEAGHLFKELQVIKPDYSIFGGKRLTFVGGGPATTEMDVCTDFFGLSETEAHYLFWPADCMLWFDEDMCNPLKSNASRKQVANHIKKFVYKKWPAPTAKIVETKEEPAELVHA